MSIFSNTVYIQNLLGWESIEYMAIEGFQSFFFLSTLYRAPDRTNQHWYMSAVDSGKLGRSASLSSASQVF